MKMKAFYLGFLLYYILTGPVFGNNNNPCLIRLSNYQIDLQKLGRQNGYQAYHGNREFNVNICGAIPKCGDNVAACVFDKSTKKTYSLGLLSTVSTAHGEIIYSYTENGVNTYVAVELKCALIPRPKLKYIPPHTKITGMIEEFVRIQSNRNYFYFTTPPPIRGTTINFIFESRDFCYRKMNCKIPDRKNRNIIYNLTPLYKKTGNWKVQNTTLKIYLNICGHLNPVTNKEDECSVGGTHVCKINEKNEARSLGSFLTDFRVEDNKILVLFENGTLCGNNNERVSTLVEFYCSHFNEQSPNLYSRKKCSYVIRWYTPAACPEYVGHGGSCKIYDRSKNVTISALSARCKLCDTVFSPCESHNESKICTKFSESKLVLGWKDPLIQVVNGQMLMKLFGEICSNGQPKLTNIHFVCDTKRQHNDTINLSPDSCVTDVKIFTNLACSENIDDPCANTKLKFLASDYNYEVEDPNDPDIMYILNFCKPINYNADALCGKYSIACMRNRSEEIFSERFISIGNMSPLAVPKYENKILTIEYEGAVCKNTTFSTKFQFFCPKNNEKEGIILDSTKGCQFAFKWHTKLICI